MEENSKSKTAVIKVLAIIGLLAMVLLGVWFLVQAVSVLPNTFSSLASIVESLNRYRPNASLSLETEKNIVNSGESFKISWTDLGREGTYDFTYACSEGVSVDVRTAEGSVVTVNCTDTLTLPENVQGLDILIASEKTRFTDLPLSVRFKDEDGEIVVEASTEVTVVNATIPQGVAILPDDSNEENEPSPSDAEDTTKDTTEPEVVATPAPTTPSVPPAPRPTPTPTVVSYIPQSYESGFTDLRMSYIGVGEQNGNSFVPKTILDNDERGAVKFEVRNIGTKTSEEWTFTVTLPTGTEYESKRQAPLKPNERAEFILGFDFDDETGQKRVEGNVEVDEDRNSQNDSFSVRVQVVN